jgi:DNA-binding LytR/AlgR family response regulator
MNSIYKTIIVDKNQDGINEIDAYLRNFKELKIILRTTSVEEAIDISLLKKPDIIVAEIELGNSKAFEIFDSLRSINFYPAIVFVAKTDAFALRAIKYRPYAYVLRPFDDKILRAAVYRIIGNVSPIIDEQIMVNSKEGDVFIKIKDIVYCKAQNSGTTLYLSKGTHYHVSSGFNDLMDNFYVYNFFKCHRSFLINLDYLKKTERRKSLSFGILSKDDEIFEVKFSDVGMKDLKKKTTNTK